MKKAIAILLSVILLFSIVSCDYKKEPALEKEDTTEQISIKLTTAETTEATVTHNTTYPEKTAINKATITKTTEKKSLEKRAYKKTDKENLLQARVIGEYINCYHLRPNVISKKGVIITFGGSEAGSLRYCRTFVLRSNRV